MVRIHPGQPAPRGPRPWGVLYFCARARLCRPRPAPPGRAGGGPPWPFESSGRCSRRTVLPAETSSRWSGTVPPHRGRAMALPTHISVLDLSKLDRAEVRLEPERTDVGTEVRDTVRLFRRQVEEAGGSLKVEAPPPPPGRPRSLGPPLVLLEPGEQRRHVHRRGWVGDGAGPGRGRHGGRDGGRHRGRDRPGVPGPPLRPLRAVGRGVTAERGWDRTGPRHHPATGVAHGRLDRGGEHAGRGLGLHPAPSAVGPRRGGRLPVREEMHEDRFRACEARSSAHRGTRSETFARIGKPRRNGAALLGDAAGPAPIERTAKSPACPNAPRIPP